MRLMTRENGSPSSVLVVRLGALGDVANTLPVVAGLRKCLPGVRLGWLAEPPADELVACANLVEDIITFPRTALQDCGTRPWRWAEGFALSRRFLRDLRSRRYECVLDMQGTFKSGLLGLLSGAPVRIGFARGYSREGNWLLNNVLAVPVARDLPRVEKHAALAQVLAPETKPTLPVEMRGTDRDAEIVKGLLDSVGPAAPLCVIHPGSSDFGRFKRWPAERFGLVASRLAGELGVRCVVTQGPGESSLAAKVCSAGGEAARLLPRLTIGQLVELLRRADLVLAGDTGPLHVAAVMGRPVVAVFGPKDPKVYRPYGPTVAMVRKDVGCNPCTRRRCRRVRCLEEIGVDEVYDSCRRMLSAGQGPSA